MWVICRRPRRSRELAPARDFGFKEKELPFPPARSGAVPKAGRAVGGPGKGRGDWPAGARACAPTPPPARYAAGPGSAGPLRELGRRGSVGVLLVGFTPPRIRSGALAGRERAQPGGTWRGAGGRGSRDGGAPTPRGAALQGPRRGDGGGRVGVGPERLLGPARADGDVREPGLREGCAGAGWVVVGVLPRGRGPEESP